MTRIRFTIALLVSWLVAAVIVVILAAPLRLEVGNRAVLALATILLIAVPVAFAVWHMATGRQ